MAGSSEHRSNLGQYIIPPSAGRHGSTVSRFQESPASINWDYFDPQDDLRKDPLWSLIDFDADSCEVKTSVNVNEEKPEDNDQKPQKGMLFSSVLKAEDYYRNYAKKTGFTVRKGKIYNQADGTLKWRRFLCSCEGFRAKKQSNQGTKYQRLDTRTGCQAQIQVTLENEQWMITNLELEHNHSLKISNESLDKSTEDTLIGPSENLEGASEADKISLAPAEAKGRDKTLRSRKPARRLVRNLSRLLRENHSEQLFEELTKLQSRFHLQLKKQGCLPQQTQEDSVSSYSEQSVAKARDEVETPCNYVPNASGQLTWEESSLPVAKSADEEFGLPSVPTIHSGQVLNTNDASHGFGGYSVSISSSTVPIPTLPITTMTSASTPVAGSSSPHPPCRQGKRSRDQGKQCTSSARVNTIVQVEGCGVSPTSESTWQQILAKYEDITAKCAFTSPMFSACVKQSILKVMKLMQDNTAHSLSSEDIFTIEHTLHDLESVQVKADWLNTRFLSVRHLIDHAKAKDNRDKILTRFNAKRAEVVQLQLELDQAEASLQQLQQRVPEGLTMEDTLDKGLL